MKIGNIKAYNLNKNGNVDVWVKDIFYSNSLVLCIALIEKFKMRFYIIQILKRNTWKKFNKDFLFNK